MRGVNVGDMQNLRRSEFICACGWHLPRIHLGHVIGGAERVCELWCLEPHTSMAMTGSSHSKGVIQNSEETERCKDDKCKLESRSKVKVKEEVQPMQG